MKNEMGGTHSMHMGIRNMYIILFQKHCEKMSFYTDK
jgi:hypothetical protein